MEWSSQARDRVSEIASSIKPANGSALQWPSQIGNFETRHPEGEAMASHLSCDFRSGISAARQSKTRQESRPGATNLEDSSKISISKISKVIDALEEREGYVSKADVIAALRVKGSDANGVRRSRPSSALEKVEGYQFKTRPCSAGASRQRQSSLVAPYPERSANGAYDALRMLKIETRSTLVEKDALRSRSREPPMRRGIPRQSSAVLSVEYKPQEAAVPRQKSVPTPSLLNFSRPYPGLRSTVCW